MLLETANMRGITARVVGGCMFLLAGSPGLFVPKVLAQNPPLVIEGGTLIDGRGGPPRENTVIVVEKNKITAIGDKGKVTYPPGSQIIPASGKFVLPGLIDTHVHWEGWMPELFLAHGVTSVVDLSSVDWHLAQKAALATGRISGPRLFAATAALTGRLFWDVSRTEPLEDPQKARKLIQAAGAGRANYALAKAYTELTADQLQALAEETHKAGRRVIAHLGSLDARQAAELGVDALAHSSGVALATIPDPVKVQELRTFERLGVAVDYPLYLMYHAYMDPAKVDELISFLIQKKVRIEPDLINTSRWASKLWPEFLAEDTRLVQDPKLKYVPEPNRERFLFDASKRLTANERQQMLRGYENLQTFLRKFVKAGGTVLAATDTASFVPPGLALHQELELLVEAGLTPMQAIQAATKNTAEFLQESEMGSIEPGNLADLIVLGKSPLADIHNTRTVEVVIKDGKVMDTQYHADFVNPIPRVFRPGSFVNPIPTVRAVYPMESGQPNKDLQLVVAGINFAEGAVVEFDDEALPTTPNKSTMIRETAFYPIYGELIATVPGRLLNRIGTYKVLVRNPKPEGGASNPLHFFVAP